MNMRVEGYDQLAAVLQKAFDQSARGKGVVRHGDGKPWHEQDIIKIGQKAGVGFNVGQAMKKLSEACGMLDRGEEQAALAEMLGAIVYTASAYYITSQPIQWEVFIGGSGTEAPHAIAPDDLWKLTRENFGGYYKDYYALDVVSRKRHPLKPTTDKLCMHAPAQPTKRMYGMLITNAFDNLIVKDGKVWEAPREFVAWLLEN